MRKKFTAYLGLFTILGAFLLLSLGSLSEATQATTSSTTPSENLERQIKTTGDSDDFESRDMKEREFSTDEVNDSLNVSESEPSQQSEEKRPEEKKSRAPTPFKSVSNIVDSISITDSNGNPITEVSQYTDIRVNIFFTLPNNQVTSGDTTTIKLPNELKLESNISFNVKNAAGHIVAIAQTDTTNNTVVLTYTDFVDSHSDIFGSLFFNSKINKENVENKTTFPVYIDVEGEQKFVGEIHYENTGDNENEKFSKYSWFANDDGTEIYNVLRINPSGNEYSDVTIEDILKTEDFSYMENTFSIKVGNWELDSNHIWQFTAEADVTNQFTINFSDNTFSIHLGNIGNKEYQITYKTKSGHAPVNGEAFTNYARMLDNETIVREVETTRVYQSGGGEADGYNYTIKIHKESEDGESLAGAEFEIVRDSTDQVVGKIETDTNGAGEISGLLKDNYTLKETKAPDGYVLSTQEIKISPEDFGTDKSILKTVTNKKKEEPKIDITGTKTWVDNDDRYGERPEEITVNLLADGEPVATKKVTASDDWKYTFTGLPKQKNGKDIVYTVTENAVENYTTEVDEFNIENTYAPIEISGIKTWIDDDDQYGERPEEITVNLLADGEQVASKKVTASDDWKYTFTGFPKQKNGKDIIYTVTENAVENYTSEIDEYNIENTYAPIEISGTKTWVDDDDQYGERPEEITVNLLADGKQVATKKVTAQDDWKYTFTGLPKQKNGKDIVYTVTEKAVENYTTEVDEFDIKNTYAPIEISGIKTWIDDDDQYGERPEEITVNLLADGKQVATKKATAQDDWKYTFTGLPKQKNGKDIVYTVTENAVENYTTEIDGYNIENTYSLGNISGTVTKQWDDSNNKDGLRPKKIEIQLYANNKKSGKPVELNEKNQWSYTWKELKAYDEDDASIQYSIQEVDVPENYKATITGQNTGNLLITNTQTANKKDDPKDSTNDKKPSSPDSPSNSKKETALTKSLDTLNDSQYKKLPSTGEEIRQWPYLAGILLVTSLGFYFYSRKRF